MADTSARMLRLLSLLQLHRHWPGNELADRLEVSDRTLRRDIDRLRSLGYPVESLRGAEGGYQLGAGSLLPPLVFDHEEAIALAIGLRDVAHGRDSHTAEASVRALAKLASMLPVKVRQQIELMDAVTDTNQLGAAGFSRSPSPELLGTIAQACRDSVRLSFTHTGGLTNATAERYVEPYRLVTRGRRWYLFAYDLDRTDWRTFRVDRITDPRPALNSFTPRALPAQDVGSFVNERISQLRPTHLIEVIVHAPHENVAAKLPNWVESAPDTTTSTKVTFTSDSVDWPIILLAETGFKITVIGPQLLTDQMHQLSAWLENASS
jgi:predicted DNA-binding transcriptional regulator YafY